MKKKKFNWSIRRSSKIRVQPFNLYDTNIYLIKKSYCEHWLCFHYSKQVCFVPPTESLFCLFVGGSEVFFLTWVWSVLFWFFISPYPSLIPLISGSDLQRELPRVHFIRAANDWERMEGGCGCSSPYHIIYMQDKFSFAWGGLGALTHGVLVPRWLPRGPPGLVAPQNSPRTAQTYVA